MYNLSELLQTIFGLFFVVIGVAGVLHWTPMIFELPVTLLGTLVSVAVGYIGYELLKG